MDPAGVVGHGSLPFEPMGNGSSSGAGNGSMIEPVLNSQNPVLYALIQTSASLSMFGALFIICSYVLFKESRKFSRKILVCLSIADLMSSAVWVWSTTISTQLGYPSQQCVIQGFLLQLFYLSSYMWTGCFAFHLYQLVWKKSSSTESFEKIYHAVGWGIPALIDLVFVVMLVEGKPSMGNVERPWCWISSSTSSTAWSATGAWNQVVFFYLPLLIVFCYNFFTYLFLARVVPRVLTSSLESKIKRRLLFYILVFMLCSVWGLINRVLQFFQPERDPPFVLIALECFFSPLQGFVNAIVYGMNEQLRDRYCRLCCQAPTPDATGDRDRLLMSRDSSGSAPGGKSPHMV